MFINKKDFKKIAFFILNIKNALAFVFVDKINK